MIIFKLYVTITLLTAFDEFFPNAQGKIFEVDYSENLISAAHGMDPDYEYKNCYIHGCAFRDMTVEENTQSGVIQVIELKTVIEQCLFDNCKSPYTDSGAINTVNCELVLSRNCARNCTCRDKGLFMACFYQFTTKIIETTVALCENIEDAASEHVLYLEKVDVKFNYANISNNRLYKSSCIYFSSGDLIDNYPEYADQHVNPSMEYCSINNNTCKDSVIYSTYEETDIRKNFGLEISICNILNNKGQHIINIGNDYPTLLTQCSLFNNVAEKEYIYSQNVVGISFSNVEEELVSKENMDAANIQTHEIVHDISFQKVYQNMVVTAFCIRKEEAIIQFTVTPEPTKVPEPTIPIDQNKDTVFTAVAASIGAVVVIAVAVIATYCVMKKKRQNSEQSAECNSKHRKNEVDEYSDVSSSGVRSDKDQNEV